MTKQEAIQEQIDNIMDSFEFDKVVKMMEATNWTWASVNGIPTEQDLRRAARERLRDAVESGASSCGGFRARREHGVDDIHGPWLSFSLQWGPEWSNEGTTYTK